MSKVYEKNAKPKYNHYEHMMATFDIRSPNSHVDWYKWPKDKVQEIFSIWDFMSMDALKEELTAEASSMTRGEEWRGAKRSDDAARTTPALRLARRTAAISNVISNARR